MRFTVLKMKLNIFLKLEFWNKIKFDPCFFIKFFIEEAN